MLKTKSKFKDCGFAAFNCVHCGIYHKVSLSQEIPKGKIKIDPFDDFLVGPPGARITCSCGADLLVLGEPDSFDVIWCNRKELFQALVLKSKPCALAAEGLYYDLIRVPHGHVPAGKVWLWRRFPLVVKEFRGDGFFKCPECGQANFFKSCHFCPSSSFQTMDDFFYQAYGALGAKRQMDLLAYRRRCTARARRDYFRRFIKDVEVLFLPVFALLGKAWYIRSERTHFSDEVPYSRRYFWRRF